MMRFQFYRMEITKMLSISNFDLNNKYVVNVYTISYKH